jgi:hypothetical protein
MLALGAIAAPVTLLTSRAAIAEPAAAAASDRDSQATGVAITIISMTPQQAAPGSAITVTGTLKNVSQQQISDVTVQLLSSHTPLSSVDELQPSASGASGLANALVPGASWLPTGQLRPGAAVRWRIHVKAKAIGMTAFGVYPLAAQAQDALADPLATSTTYLPYVPAKRGPYGSTIPARTKISWVWPLIDKPLLNQPGQSVCQGGQAKTLAASLGNGGRLFQLVSAGATVTGTAEAYAASEGLGRAVTAHAVRSQPSQSLASYDSITWAIDPALLADAKALAACGSAQPKWAAAARLWLKTLGQVSADQPVFVTPYADPNVAALIGASPSHTRDVQRAFVLGRRIGGQVLRRPLSPAATAGTPAAQGQTASIAWPSGGIAGYTTVENLAAAPIGVRTLLLSSSYPRSSVLRTPNGGGSYTNVLVANDSLTQLLSSGGSTAAAAFATSQEFLAETALLAEQNPGEPIVVAPPQRWMPAPRLAATLLAGTASASWLSPVSLTALTTLKNIPIRQPPAGHKHRKLSSKELGDLGRVEAEIAQLEVLKARRDSADYQAVAAAESSAWQSAPKAALNMLASLGMHLRQEEHSVRIEAEPRITLGGLKGSVPVSIDNSLGYAVVVRLVPSSQSGGIKITVSPGGGVSRSGLVTIPAGDAVTVRLRVEATQVGSSTITLALQNRNGQQLRAATPMTVQATQVGVLGVIICAVALGVFLIATGARAARRGRPLPAANQATSPDLAGHPADGRSGEGAEPDTVMAERTELGTAGTPGP